MTTSLEKNLSYFASQEGIDLFRGIKRGFEKESLRVDREGIIAQTPHPQALGSSLTHPYITTDYSEALLEFITPPSTDLNQPFQMLTALHAFTYRVLQDEILWASSMPCRLPEEENIPIAEYGSSNIGQLKHIYRRGLGKRYGRAMQTIAGIHYNFSLPEAFFWVLYQAKNSVNGLKPPKLSLQDFISEQYLGLIRNSLRWGWLLPLLFGSTPAVCENFLNPQAKLANFLKPFTKNTYYGPNATSLRLSDLGYHNKADASSLISYNSFPEFLKTMHAAVHTEDPNFKKIGIKMGEEYQQLSDSILQSEDEHYALVRPKRVSLTTERTLSALMRDGIEYIEVRALDINPFLPLGVEPRTIFILDVFLITCLLMDSPRLETEEIKQIYANQYQVVTEGRNESLQITNIAGQTGQTGQGQHDQLQTLAKSFLNLMAKTAVYLDKAYKINNFSIACASAANMLLDMKQLPSARVIQEMKSKDWSYFEFARHWSLQHKHYFDQLHFSDKMVKYYELLAKDSLQKQLEIEKSDTLPFSEFLAQFLAP